MHYLKKDHSVFFPSVKHFNTISTTGPIWLNVDT